MVQRIGFIAIACALALLPSRTVLAQQGSASPIKIAYINSTIIVNATPGRAELQAEVEKKLQPISDRLKAIQDSNRVMLTEYQAVMGTLSADAKAAREKSMGEKQNLWAARQDSLNLVAQNIMQAAEQPMADLLKKILGDIRAEDGYWMILDLAQEGGLSIVAIDRNMDITDRVLARYKVAAAALPKGGSGTAGGPPPAGPVSSGSGVGVKIPPTS